MAFDTSDKNDTSQETDARSDAADVSSRRLSSTGIAAMQGNDTPDADQPGNSFHAQTSTTELGDVARAEAGPERSEARILHDVAKPEAEEASSPYREGRV